MAKMKVNPLPVTTWHWTGMNDSELEMSVPYETFRFILESGMEGMQLAADPMSCSSDAAVLSDPDDIGTGMGEEFDKIMRDKQAVYLDIPEGYSNAAPAVLTAKNCGGKAAGRIFIRAGKDSETALVIAVRGEGMNDDEWTTALQLKVYAEPGAHLKLFVVQLLPCGGLSCLDTGMICEDGAKAEFICLPAGSKKTYTGINVRLKGRESAFSGEMGYHVGEDENVDVNYVAVHEGKGSLSSMNAWGVLDEGSKKLFRGTIDFKEGCSGSKGSEKEDVLLLGEHEVNQTIPLILCNEEDVEGNHGATISRLDEDVLFYLGSRGVAPEAAEKIISGARMEALYDKIPDISVRNAVGEWETER